MGIIKRILKKDGEEKKKKSVTEDNIKFKKGMPVFLDIETGANDKNVTPPSSYVKEVHEDGGMTVNQFTQAGVVYKLPENKEMTMYYVNEAAKFAFSVNFFEEIKINGMDYIKLKRTGRVTETNRRDSYRIKLSLPVKIEIIPVEEDCEEKHPLNVDGQTVDLSRSGARFVTDWYIDEKQETAIIIDLDKDQQEKLKVSFIRMTESGNQYDFRVKLEYMDVNQQNRYFGYLAEKEREESRRERKRKEFGK